MGQCRNVTKARDSPPRGVAHPLPPLSGTKFLINIPSHLSVGNTYTMENVNVSWRGASCASLFERTLIKLYTCI